MGKIKIDRKDQKTAQTQPDPQPQAQGQVHPAERLPEQTKPINTALWRVLLLPSLLILAVTIILYYLRPARDAFINGNTANSYLLYGTYAAWSPKFWMIGLSSILWIVMLIFSIARTVARGEWRYWQRLLGLIALAAAAIVLLITGLPEIGTDARDAGSTSLNGHYYHLLVQSLPDEPNVILRFMIFDCDQGAINCQRVQSDDVKFASSDRVPALGLMQIKPDGQVIITQGNTSTEHYSLYRPQ